MSLTAANCTITLLATSNAGSALFPVPTQLQGFTADDVTDSEDVAPVEAVMGVDGWYTGGFRYVPVIQGFTLQGDSPSTIFFDLLYEAMKATLDVYYLSGSLLLPGPGKLYVMSKGLLTGYKPTPDVKAIVGSQKFKVSWGTFSASPVA